MDEETRFYDIEPTRENYWRAIILFGRNVASYKFALAKSLFDLRKRPNPTSQEQFPKTSVTLLLGLSRKNKYRKYSQIKFWSLL